MRDIKEWFGDLLEFFWAVINSWAGYATGGIIVALVWLWSTVFSIPVSRRTGIGLAVFFLVMAFFNAWRKQFRQRLDLQKDINRRDNKTGIMTLISSFASEGEYLLHVNPDEHANDEQIQEWRSKVANWVQKTSDVLWAIGRNKFNQFLDTEMSNFHGAHESVWSDLNMLRQRIRNLNEIIEKPEIYLTRIG